MMLRITTYMELLGRGETVKSLLFLLEIEHFALWRERQLVALRQQEGVFPVDVQAFLNEAVGDDQDWAVLWKILCVLKQVHSGL